MNCHTATEARRRKPRHQHRRSLFRQLGQSLCDSSPGRPASAANGFCGLHLECLEDRDLLSINHAELVDHYLPPQYHLFEYSGFLTAPSAAAPVVIAEDFLRSRADDLGLLTSDLDNYVVTTNYVTQSTGATTLTLAQSLHGLDVVNANFNFTVAADGRLLNAGGGFVPRLSQRADEVPFKPGMGSDEAIIAAANTLGLALAQPPQIVQQPQTGPAIYNAPEVSLDDITTTLQYVAMPNDDVSLTWHLTVRTPDNSHWYSVNVDSYSGSVVLLNDYASHAQYEVYAHPLENPSDGGRSIEIDPHVLSPVPATIPSPFGWHDASGTPGAEYTITRGNNVNAYADRNADNFPDPGSQPDGGPSLDFTGPLVNINLGLSPVTYTQGAVANLFYWNNILHDVHYLYGFDEAARNFQVNNYGHGGFGNDAVNAEAQDGSGTNNANFFTPPDGSQPRMQMYEWTYGSPARDSDLDAGIIAHEYGHGVSNRLTGNGNGLNALQSGGMGEGWSDWWGLMLTQKTAGETTVGRGIGTYVLHQPTTGLGIRDFRYNFNITDTNLETFNHYGTGPGQSVAVHSTGTRWSAALWDLNHLLIQKYGFESNVYDSTSNAGNIKALHLVMNALKIQPLNPSLVQARDAVLLADNLLYGGANQLQIWTAFARRGLGQFASTPSSNSTELTPSFVIPPEVLGLVISLSVPANGAVVNAARTSFTIGFSDAVNPATVQPGDLLVNGVPATSVFLAGGNKFAGFSFSTTPMLTQGIQTLTIPADAIERGDGDGNELYDITFRWDALPLAVVSTSPSAGGGFSGPGPATLDLNFNEPIDPASVQTSDLVVGGFPGATVTSVEVLAGNTTARFTIGGLTTEGTLQANLAASAITDAFGNPGTAFSANYYVDIGTRPYPTPLLNKLPLGSLIYDPEASGQIQFPGDVDEFTIELDANQRVTVLVDPLGGLLPDVELIGPLDEPLATGAAAAGGDNVVLQNVATTGPGTYKIRVGGVAGSVGPYTVRLVLNAALEEEHFLPGGSNDTPASAQSLDGAAIALGGAASRAAILGTADEDWYSFTLAESDTITVLLANSPADALEVALYDPSDVPLALGAAVGTNVNRVIADLPALTAGSYKLRVTGAGAGQYSLLVLRNASFDLEANSTTLKAQTVQGARINGEQRVLGFTGGNAAQFDLRGTPMAGAFTLSGSNITLGINVDGSFIQGGVGIQFLGNEFVTPGTPVASFTVGRDGQNFTNNAANGVADILISSMEDLSSGTLHGARIVGTVGGNLQIERVILFEDDDEFATISTRLTNLSAVTSSNVAWLENLDPDQGAPLGASFSTFNDVVLGGEFVRADAKPFGFPEGLTIGLGSADPRRVVSAEGFDNRDPFSILQSPVDPNGFPEDIAIALAFDYGEVAPGEAVWSTLVMAFGTSPAAAEANYASADQSVDIDGGDLFAFQAEVGQVIELATSTPGDGSGEFVNGLNPRLRILDADGVELASNDDGAPDGRNAILVFIAPATGQYFVEILSSDVDDTAGEYVLTLTNASQVAPPFSVTSISPLDGELLAAVPSQIIVTFNDAVYLPTLEASDLRIDGLPAANVTQLNGNTLSFEFLEALPDGVHTISLGAGSISDVQATSLTAFSSTFTLDQTAPRVAGTSLAPGAIGAPGDLVYQVTFDEPLDAASIFGWSFSLAGVYRQLSYFPDSFELDPSGTVATLTYSGLPDDQYLLSLSDGTDPAGNHLDGEFSGTFPSGDGLEFGLFVVDFQLDLETEGFATPLQAQLPLGSLIYASALQRVISFDGDTDSFLVAVDAGQTISVSLVPGANLSAAIEVQDPDGATLGVSSGGVGATQLLQTLPATTEGVYRITISGAPGSTGLYDLQVTLNAALEEEGLLPGVENDSLATAQNIDSSFLQLVAGGSPAARAAAWGTADGLAGYAATSVPFSFEDISATGTTVLQGVDDSVAFVDIGFSFNLYDVAYTSLFVSSNGLITFDFGDASYNNNSLEFSPFPATIAALWDDLYIVNSGRVLVQALGPVGSRQLVIQWDQVNFISNISADTITFQAILYEGSDEIRLNYLDLSSDFAFGNEGGSATVGIKSIYPTDGNFLQLALNNGPNAYVGTGQSVVINRGLAEPDLYSFTLNAGQPATLAATLQTAGLVHVELVNEAGDIVGLGTYDAQTRSSVISNVTVETTGVYYARVFGTLDQYSLVVTRNAALDTEQNNNFDLAQDIGSAQGVLGHVGLDVVYAYDATSGEIRAINAHTGAVVTSYFSPVVAALGPDFGMASTGSTLLVGGSSGYGIAEINPNDGSYLRTVSYPWVDVSGMAYLNGELFLLSDELDGQITVVSYATGEILRTLTTFPGAVSEGLAASSNELLAVSGATLYAIDPLTGQLTLRGALAGTVFAEGLAVLGTELFVSDTSIVRVYDLATLTLKRTLTGYNNLEALGGDNVGALPGGDWYSLEVTAAGTRLRLQSSTPADGLGEFVNAADPQLELYGPSGALLIGGSPLADGRNESIDFVAPQAGTYRVHVAGRSAGEYFLGVRQGEDNASSVVGRRLFYNQSGSAAPLRYDGNDPAINALDDQAIATDKTALLPGQTATFANVSSYSKGINGIMMDLAGTHGELSAADFVFKIGNNNAPSTWATAPAPVSLAVRSGAGVNGSDRVEIVWANGAIRNTWLQVVINGNDLAGGFNITTGLAASESFFFGSAVGNSGLGDSPTFATVNTTDEIAARIDPQGLANNIAVTSIVDYNRDGRVDVTDQLVARNNPTSLGNVLRYLSLANPPAAPAVEIATGAEGLAAGSGVADVAAYAQTASATASDSPRLPRWITERLTSQPARREQVAALFEVLEDPDKGSPRSYVAGVEFELALLDDDLLDDLFAR